MRFTGGIFGPMIVFPNAKINVGLHITSKRPDGYHNIESIFYPVPLCDCLEVIQDDASETDVIFTSSGIHIPGNADTNLCVKAYYLLKENHDLPKVRIHLHKIIPIGAGLGGGSADAAFFLTLMNKMFNLKIAETELETIAAKLGSDCVFFIKNTPAYVSGRGEIIDPMNLSLAGSYLVLVYPNIHISTAEAYSLISPRKSTVDLKNVNTLQLSKNEVTNDFEQPLIAKYPEIGHVKQKLIQSGAYYAAMTGSGSCVYGLFGNEPGDIEFGNFFSWKGKL